MLLLHMLTVPEVLCLQTPISTNGKIRVSWDYSHTGGLNLTQVKIDYRIKQLESFRLLPESLYSNEELLRTKGVEILNFTAGFEYVFRVTASNEIGSSSVECPSVFHLSLIHI